MNIASASASDVEWLHWAVIGHAASGREVRDRLALARGRALAVLPEELREPLTNTRLQAADRIGRS